MKHLSDLSENTLHEMISCPYYKVFKLNLNGSYTMEQTYPFLNISVLDGYGQIDGHELKKGDHLILPAGYGRMELQGRMECVASAVSDAAAVPGGMTL